MTSSCSLISQKHRIGCAGSFCLFHFRRPRLQSPNQTRASKTIPAVTSNTDWFFSKGASRKSQGTEDSTSPPKEPEALHNQTSSNLPFTRTLKASGLTMTKQVTGANFRSACLDGVAGCSPSLPLGDAEHSEAACIPCCEAPGAGAFCLGSRNSSFGFGHACGLAGLQATIQKGQRCQRNSKAETPGIQALEEHQHNRKL